METLLVHADIAQRILPRLGKTLSDKGVELRGCERTRALLPQALVATEEYWLTEYLAPILAIRVVDSLDQAIDHIARYSSEHTESIVTENLRSEEHTSELQSLMRISYAVFCLKKKNQKNKKHTNIHKNQ